MTINGEPTGDAQMDATDLIDDVSAGEETPAAPGTVQYLAKGIGGGIDPRGLTAAEEANNLAENNLNNLLGEIDGLVDGCKDKDIATEIYRLAERLEIAPGDEVRAYIGREKDAIDTLLSASLFANNDGDENAEALKAALEGLLKL
ncbi:MAG: hypothetical protein WC227_02430 [Patescibacteria group bacterium]|jgi:hypothetical protein